MRRRKDRVDENQEQLVEDLRKLPGVTVKTGHDDLIIGYNKRSFWVEVKDPEKTKSKRTGKLLKSALRDSQKKTKEEFTGQYDIVFTVDDCKRVIGYRIND